MILFNENEIADIEEIGEIEEPEATNEGYSPDYEGMMLIIAESNTEWGIVNEAILYGDMHELNESFKPNGNVQAIQEANIQGMFDAVKKFFQRLWAKVKEFFKRFIDQINAWLMDEKKFIEKYGKAFTDASLANFEMKAYDWAEISKYAENLGRVIDIAGKSAEEAKKLVEETINAAKAPGTKTESEHVTALSTKKKELIEKWKKGLDGHRAALIGGSGEVTAAEFNKVVKYTLRNGGKFTKSEPSKVDLKASNINRAMIVKELKDAAKTKNTINVMQTRIDGVYKCILSAIQAEENTLRALSRTQEDKNERNWEAMCASVCSAAHNHFKAEAAIANSFCGAISSALKERNGDYKSIVIKVLSNSRKPAPQQNSYNIYEEADMDPEEIADVDTGDKKEQDQSDITENAVSKFLAKQGW